MEEFGRRIGISKGYIGNIEKNIYIPSEKVLILIEKEFGISREWIKTGTESMRMGEFEATVTDRERAVLRKYRLADQKIRKVIDELLDLPTQDIRPTIHETLAIPDEIYGIPEEPVVKKKA
jgi:transcriptional regulator with XRE-family HTH domain